MGTKERRAAITDRLSTVGEASISELANSLGTSEMTIRRDLEVLEFDGLARRVRGGAISTISRSYEPPILLRGAEHADAKKRIGLAAASLVAQDESAVLDVGTTTLAMARAIPTDFTMTVVTSSLLIATQLVANPNVRTIVTGGCVRHGEMSLAGPRAESFFADFNCDSVFLGVAGVSAEKGLTEYNIDDAAIKQAAIRAGRRVVVLADASKIGRVAFVSVAPLSCIDLLVSDAAPGGPIIESIKDQGVEVLHVEPFTQEGAP